MNKEASYWVYSYTALGLGAGFCLYRWCTAEPSGRTTQHGKTAASKCRDALGETGKIAARHLQQALHASSRNHKLVMVVNGSLIKGGQKKRTMKEGKMAAQCCHAAVACCELASSGNDPTALAWFHAWASVWRTLRSVTVYGKYTHPQTSGMPLVVGYVWPPP